LIILFKWYNVLQKIVATKPIFISKIKMILFIKSSVNPEKNINFTKRTSSIQYNHSLSFTPYKNFCDLIKNQELDLNSEEIKSVFTASYQIPPKNYILPFNIEIIKKWKSRSILLTKLFTRLKSLNSQTVFSLQKDFNNQKVVILC
ncbi:hypothetical protein, partial [Flavobacterium columnare]